MILLGFTLSFLAGCSSTPVAEDSTAVTIFQQPIERVQKAAVDALVVTGFDVTKQESNHVEGFRPRKVGFFVGSGGETVGIWLVPQGSKKTAVKIDTAQSFAGNLGQKNWDNEILNEMKKSFTP
jgi:hypothetical protein